jgi:uncharacterized protein
MKRPLCFLSLVIFLFLATSCSHLFYQPDAFLYTDKEKIQKYFKENEIQGTEGKIIAWTFSNPDLKLEQKKPVHIILFHGNAQNVSSHFYSLFWILEKGYDYTIFDYPGYGGSEGEPTRKSTTQSGIDVYNWIKSRHPDQKIFIFGQSLGGNISIYSASRVIPDPQLCGIAVESTFLNYHTVAQRLLAKNWFTWIFQPIAYALVSDSYSASEAIHNLGTLPLLVMHGDQDPIVGFENGRDLFEAASQPKTFIEISGGQHIDALTFQDRNKYQKIFTEFIDQSCVQ